MVEEKEIKEKIKPNLFKKVVSIYVNLKLYSKIA